MEGVSISRWGRRFAGVLLIVSAVARPASADRGPSRADFERAVLAEAATRTDPTACERPGAEPGPARAIPRADRARVLGRILALGDRRAAVVRVATARTDANDDLAHRLFVVVLAPRGGGWRPDARAEIPLGDAPFDYGDEPALRIARLEDVDDDGEEELFVVLSTDTEVRCGTGYCTVRRTVILDPETLAIAANVRTGRDCQASVMDRVRGTSVFRDTDGDGHRDLVVRRRRCPGARIGPDDRVVEPPCDPPQVHVHRYDPSRDRYAAPDGD